MKLSYIWDSHYFITQPFILSILRNASPSYVPISTSILSSIVVSVFVITLLWCVTSGWMYTRWWHKVNITWVSILRTSTHTSSWVLHLCFSGTVIALRMVPGIRRVNHMTISHFEALASKNYHCCYFTTFKIVSSVFIHSSLLTVCCSNDEQFRLDLSFLIEISNFLFLTYVRVPSLPLFVGLCQEKKQQVRWHHFYLIRLVL